MRKYISETDKGVANGVVPLNSGSKIDAEYLPNYTDVNYIPNDEAAGLNAKQTWTIEQTYNYDDYGLAIEDTISGVAAGFKAPRGLFNMLFVDDIVFTRGTTGNTANVIADEIGIYTFTDVDSKAAVRDSSGKITTPGYNDLVGYTKVAAITKDGGLILKSSTAGSSKYFKLTVDDSGAIHATQVSG